MLELFHLFHENQLDVFSTVVVGFKFPFSVTFSNVQLVQISDVWYLVLVNLIFYCFHVKLLIQSHSSFLTNNKFSHIMGN